MANTLLADVSFAGPNGSTVFTDATGQQSWTALGDAQIQGNALVLDGTGDGVQTTGANFAFGENDFSISFDMKQPPGSGYRILIELLNTVSPQWLWRVHTNSGILRWVADSSTLGNVEVLRSPARLDDDTWKSIKLERSSRVLTLYVDSVPVASTPDDRVYGNDAPLTFGTRTQASPPYSYVGLLRNLKIERGDPPAMPDHGVIASWTRSFSLWPIRGYTSGRTRRFIVAEPVDFRSGLAKIAARVCVTRGVPTWWGTPTATTQLPTYRLRGRVMQRDPDGVLEDYPVKNVKVALFFRRLHTLVDIQWSDENGYVEFKNLMPGNQAYYGIAIDREDPPMQNSILWDRLTPEPGS